MATKTLNKSEIKKINEQTQNLYGKEFINKKDLVQIIDEPIKHIKINKKPTFFFYKDKPIPFLKKIYEYLFLKKITVDMGAIKFICNGADVMKTGITKIDDGIKEEEIIVIIDEKNQKPLVIGEALFDGDEITKREDGKVIKNLHHVSDDKWDLI